MHPTDDVYAERGLGERQGAGKRPALIVVDLNYAFTDPQSPLNCGADDAVSATASLLSAAGRRTAGGVHDARVRRGRPGGGAGVPRQGAGAVVGLDEAVALLRGE